MVSKDDTQLIAHYVQHFLKAITCVSSVDARAGHVKEYIASKIALALLLTDLAMHGLESCSNAIKPTNCTSGTIEYSTSELTIWLLQSASSISYGCITSLSAHFRCFGALVRPLSLCFGRPCGAELLLEPFKFSSGFQFSSMN